jgi:hypothetical protein
MELAERDDSPTSLPFARARALGSARMLALATLLGWELPSGIVAE